MVWYMTKKKKNDTFVTSLFRTHKTIYTHIYPATKYIHKYTPIACWLRFCTLNELWIKTMHWITHKFHVNGSLNHANFDRSISKWRKKQRYTRPKSVHWKQLFVTLRVWRILDIKSNYNSCEPKTLIFFHWLSPTLNFDWLNRTVFACQYNKYILIRESCIKRYVTIIFL